jgi:signal transduction histidine kinase
LHSDASRFAGHPSHSRRAPGRAAPGDAVVSLLVEAQERERRRIADDIHDDSLQVLSAVLLGFHQLRGCLDTPRALELVDRLEQDVDLAARRLRWLMFELQPSALGSEGLVAALRRYLTAMAEEAGLSFDLVADSLRSEPPRQTRTILYRIVQEALANARKHSRARHVRVCLESADGGFLTTIADDGAGFDAAGPMHLGLETMRERAEVAGGWFHAAGSPDTGTTVAFWLPGPA